MGLGFHLDGIAGVVRENSRFIGVECWHAICRLDMVRGWRNLLGSKPYMETSSYYDV